MPHKNKIICINTIHCILILMCFILPIVLPVHNIEANNIACTSQDWTECADKNQKSQWIEYAKDWKFIKQKGDISLYKRVLPTSGIIQVKAERIINAPLEVVEQIIRDIPAYPQLMYNCIEGREIKQFTDEDIVILNVTKMPWPLQPRDVVVRTKVIKDWDYGRIEIALQGLHSPESEQWVPLIAGHTRMYELTAYFIGHILDRNKIKCIYIIHADPTGVPLFAINFLIANYPYYTLLNLEKMTKLEKYINLGKKSKYLSKIESFVSFKKKLNN
ncbi:MAG: hypothetical protein Kow00102_08790 [Spirochaetota bacterium]